MLKWIGKLGKQVIDGYKEGGDDVVTNMYYLGSKKKGC